MLKLDENEQKIDDKQRERDEAEAVYKKWFDACQAAKASGDKVAFMTAKAELEWAGEVVQEKERAFQRVFAEVGAAVEASKRAAMAKHEEAADLDVLRHEIRELAKEAGSHESVIRDLRRKALRLADKARQQAEMAHDVARELKITAIVPQLDDDEATETFDSALRTFADALDPKTESEAAE